MENVNSSIRHLGKNSILFGLGYFMPIIVNVMLLPIYIRFITPSEYGILSLLSAFGAVLTIIMGLSINRAIERFYIQYEPGKRKEFLGSTVALVLLFSFSLSVVLTIMAPKVSFVFFNSTTIKYINYVNFQIWISFFLIFPQIISSIYLIKEKSSSYVILRIVNLLILIIAIVTFLIVFKRGLRGILEATCFSTGIMAIFYMMLVLPEIKLSLVLTHIKTFLKYSFPIMPYRLFIISIAYMDRFYINKFFSLSDVGIYSVGSRFSMIMEIVVTSFAIAWQPFYYNRAEKNNFDSTFKKLVTLWITFLVFVALAISSYAREIIIIFTSPEYYSVYRIMPILVLGHIFLAFYFFSMSTILYTNKTKIMPLLSGVACLVNIGLLSIVNIRFGILGPAICKAIAYLTVWLLAYMSIFSISKVSYEYKKIISIIFIGFITFMISYNINFNSLLANILMRGSVILLYPISLYLLKLVDFRNIFTLFKKATQDISIVEDNPTG